MLDSKLVLKDLSIDDFYGFANHLEDEGYNPSTIKRMLSRMKFFCARCSEEGIKVSSAFTQRVFVDDDSSEIEGVYLNEEEIDRIFNLDLSDNYNLDHARDNFILSCYTAIRVSDLMNNLDTSKIKEGIIRIKTIKTKTFVSIPMHDYVEQILNKRFGNLPCKFSDYDYNCYIKDICKLAKIDKITYGKLWDKEKKRKVIGNRPKYMYISSHTARKSFATNLIGKVSDEVLMSVAGWNTSEMLKHYNKASKDDNAKELKKYWLSKKE
jgi:integrase